MRLTLLRGLFIVLLIGAGCTDTQPCQTCPPVDGLYSVSWGDPVRTPLSDGGVCFVMGPRVDTFVLAQNGSNVTTEISNVPLGGSLYDTFDMVLSGAAGSLSYRFKALSIPEGTSRDAGMRLQGNFTTRDLTPDAGDLCEVVESFNAQRISR